MQTWEYAVAKAQTEPWAVERAIFLDDGRIVGAVQSLRRSIPWLGGGVLWINRGPLWRRSEKEHPSLLVAMMEELRRHWVEQQQMYLRIVPPIREDELGLNALGAIGYNPCGGSPGWASARLDLSCPIETLRSQLHQKWRNCLNKAERLALTVQAGPDDSLFDQLLVSYEKVLLDRRYRTTVTPQLLARLQALLPPERKLWAFIGMQDGRSLGGVIIGRFGQVCEYLVGAVNDAGRAVNATHFLLWGAVCKMKDLVYRWFDLGGMDSRRTPKGVLHFKTGLGATPYRLVGDFEAHNGAWLNRVVRWRVRRAMEAVRP